MDAAVDFSSRLQTVLQDVRSMVSISLCVVRDDGKYMPSVKFTRPWSKHGLICIMLHDNGPCIDLSNHPNNDSNADSEGPHILMLSIFSHKPHVIVSNFMYILAPRRRDTLLWQLEDYPLHTAIIAWNIPLLYFDRGALRSQRVNFYVFLQLHPQLRVPSWKRFGTAEETSEEAGTHGLVGYLGNMGEGARCATGADTSGFSSFFRCSRTVSQRP